MATHVSSALPQLDVQPNYVYTVTLDDPAAVITQLIVHAWQDYPAAELAAPEETLTLTQLDRTSPAT